MKSGFLVAKEIKINRYYLDQWQEKQYPLKRDQWGVWHLTMPALSDGTPAIKHGQVIKVWRTNLIVHVFTFSLLISY